MPRFSVVISVFNKEDQIGDTINSVLAQTETDFEIVILNDGSTDASETVIEGFTTDPRIRYYSEKNQGASAGRNFLIKKAKGEFIALLDGDDLWLPNYLDEIKRLISVFPNEAVYATNSEKFNGRRIISRNYSVDISKFEEIKVNLFEASYEDSIVNSSSVVLKKDVFEKIGYYNPNLKSGEDTDLFVRLGLNYPVVFSPKVCTQILILDNSLSHTSLNVETKASFAEYENLEGNNEPLKKFLDLNRYSLCLLAILDDNQMAFEKFRAKIDLQNLNKKQRFLLKQNKTTLRRLLKTKKSLAKLGLKLSAFK